VTNDGSSVHKDGCHNSQERISRKVVVTACLI